MSQSSCAAAKVANRLCQQRRVYNHGVCLLTRSFALIAYAVLAFSSLLAAPTAAQTASVPADRLNALRVSTSLYRGDLKPWYLKIEAQINNTDGKPTDKATIEEWWGSENLDKRVYTTAKGKTTYLRKDDRTYRSDGYEYPGYFLDQLSTEIVNPVPFAKPIEKASVKKEDFGKVSLDCLEFDPPVVVIAPPYKPSVYPKLTTQYCVSPEGDVLRAILGADHIDFLRNTLGKFQDRAVAIDVTARAGNIVRATAHIAALTSKPLPPDVFSTDGLIAQPSEPRSIPSGVMAGKLLSKQAPVYPELAKRQHVQGVVYLHAFIGKEGTIHSLELLSSPNSILNRAATDAVQQWTYQPYLLNGNPVEVETTIEVHFSFGSS